MSYTIYKNGLFRVVTDTKRLRRKEIRCKQWFNGKKNIVYYTPAQLNQMQLICKL